MNKIAVQQYCGVCPLLEATLSLFDLAQAITLSFYSDMFTLYGLSQVADPVRRSRNREMKIKGLLQQLKNPITDREENICFNFSFTHPKQCHTSKGTKNPSTVSYSTSIKKEVRGRQGDTQK